MPSWIYCQHKLYHYLGKEIFVGVGKRTNEAGAQAVAEAFPEYAVSKVNFANCEALHLKDVFNMAGRNVMAVAPGPDVQAVLRVSELPVEYLTATVALFTFCSVRHVVLIC